LFRQFLSNESAENLSQVHQGQRVYLMTFLAKKILGCKDLKTFWNSNGKNTPSSKSDYWFCLFKSHGLSVLQACAGYYPISIFQTK